MKTYLARTLSLAGILCFSSQPAAFAQSADHTVPVAQNAATPVTIPDTFAPFGARPDTDKIGDDGSVAVRDRNGVILWTDSQNNSSVLPKTSLAKTLYVSNTECVVYNNRFAADYNLWGSVSEIIIYRRNADNTVVAAPTITVRGTLLDTSSVTPNSFGFTIVSAYGFNYSTTESKLTTWEKKLSGDSPPITTYSASTVDYDQWHNINYEMYRITWDAVLQSLSFTTVFVPKSGTNLGGTTVLGNGDDGSIAFHTIAAETFSEDRGPVDPTVVAKSFKITGESLWATWQINSENIRSVDFNRTLPNAAYVSNSRLLLESEIYTTTFLPGPPATSVTTPTGDYTILDYRMSSKGVISFAGEQPLDPGERLLSVYSYTRGALPPYIYTTDAPGFAYPLNTGKQLKLYRYDTTLDPLGGAITLPTPVVSGSQFVRNPRDASLLIKSNGADGILWIPSDSATAPTALTAARSLPNSTLGLPMFVSSTEAIAWMNNGASVDLSLGGQLPFAEILHFTPSLTPTVLAPPIDGRYVALPSPLTPEPESEGWFVSTFRLFGR